MEKINRRKALQTFGGLSLMSFNPVFGNESFDNISKSMKKEIKTDILVIGGGTAGVIAAIQAGRAGVSTILVENGSQLGGTTTTGGVSFPGLFHAWGKQIIRGIGWELIMDTVHLDDGELPNFSIPTGRQHWKHQIRINPYIYVLLAEDKCTEAGVKIRYYETPVKVNFNGDNWEVDTVGKGIQTKIICKQLIDCTGNANIISLAGLNLLRDKETQPGTQIFEFGGYNIEKLDLEMIQKRFAEEVKKGNMLYSDARGNMAHFLGVKGDNAQHVLNADSSTSELHTLTNLNGRASALRILRFLRGMPGCDKTQLLDLQPETAVRETYRIDGEYQVSHQDYMSGKLFYDSLAYSFYPIDLHDPKGIIPKHLEQGVVPTIPLRALIPKHSRNLMVAGRCISSDRFANSALRVQASCMAMGQVAGATAALAVKFNTSPINIPIAPIKDLLTNHGAIVP
ncbi:MAG: FAD-dependent oxidoreductase [Bacteroidota bacterium]